MAEEGTPPAAVLDDKKWKVENIEGTRDEPKMIEITIETNQSVYAYKCKFVQIVITGKGNSVTLDNCTDTACVFDDMVGGFETVRCKKLQVQAKGFVPTVQIDNTEAIVLYASKAAEAQGMAVIQSMSTEINLTILPPDEDEEAEPVELPLPSQFVTKFVDGKWVTEPNEHLA